LSEDSGQQQSVTFAARQCLYRGVDPLRREQKVFQISDDMARTALNRNVIGVAEVLAHRPLGVENTPMLIEVRQLQARAHYYFSAGRPYLTQNQLEQRSFAGAVRTDNANPITTQYARRHLPNNQFIFVGETYTPEIGHQLS
jgi:hypothetical protein